MKAIGLINYVTESIGLKETGGDIKYVFTIKRVESCFLHELFTTTPVSLKQSPLYKHRMKWQLELAEAITSYRDF